MTVPLEVADFDAIVLDLDGVVTDTAAVHQAAWRRLFEGFFQHRRMPTGATPQPFGRADYVAYVDGKSRHEAARAFLAARGIKIPHGIANDPPHRETICGLANRKDIYFVELVAARGLRVYAGTVRLVAELQRRGLQSAVVSTSRHCRMVLAAAGLSALFPVRVDGVDAERLGLAGKPEPAMLLEAVARLGVRPDRAIVVEDAEAGVLAGRRGEFGLVIGIERVGDEHLRTHGAGLVVPDLREVEPVGFAGPVGSAEVTKTSSATALESARSRPRVSSRYEVEERDGADTG
ncbi:MAG: HAD family hydrolase [Nocardioidaceae bacterium]